MSKQQNKDTFTFSEPVTPSVNLDYDASKIYSDTSDQDPNYSYYDFLIDTTKQGGQHEAAALGYSLSPDSQTKLAGHIRYRCPKDVRLRRKKYQEQLAGAAAGASDLGNVSENMPSLAYSPEFRAKIGG